MPNRHDESDPQERSTFLQGTGTDKDDPVPWWLVVLPTAVVLALAFANGDWIRAVMVGAAAYLGLAVIYALLAYRFGWRRPRWMAVVGEIFDWFTWWWR